MSVENVRKYLKQFNLDNKIQEFNVSSKTVADAAKALNCKEQEIAKTMSFLVNDSPILIVLAGDCKISNQKFKETFNCKAKMIAVENLQERTGHIIGGVCPFANPESVVTYLDESLKRFNYVYPACGSDNSAIKLTIAELEKASSYKKWIDVSNIMEEQI